MNLKDKVIVEIKKIYDPEIPVNIYELGLIYKVEVDETNKVNIDMTLTSPNCPAAESLPNQVIEEVKKIYDPEIPVNIYEMGLIYKIKVDETNKVNIDMTLTSPNCPVAESLPKEVKDNIMKIKGVSDVSLNLVWEPPWDKDMMSEAAKLELNL